MDKYTVNKKYFGHDRFRPGQEALIDSILSGRDTLGIMPTGGGKSICYQVPSLLLPGLTLVISPLISLMKDQVSALEAAGVPAAYLNSSLDTESYREACRRVRQGRCKLLYVAPERLENERFLQLIETCGISLAAVDEAHCISQWGQDFRPSYLRIPRFLEALPQRPVVAAFTATATEDVRRDVARLLELRDPFVQVTGFDRPNLYFDVQRPKDKLAALLALVRKQRGRSGIVYCATRAKTEEVCRRLQEAGISAACYHAGLTDQERMESQEAFRFDRVSVMAATNAFGMGIDKSNVGFVIHFNMPKSLEAYYQEAGRAGRDGEPAECILLYSPRDVATAKFLIENGEENEAMDETARAEVRRQDYRRLEAMAGYCKTTGCFRAYILRYFGQEPPDRCGNCGSCRSETSVEDITIQAQMILSCVKRMQDRLGYSVGATLVIQVLRGAKNKRLLDLGLDSLSTYGLLSRISQPQVSAYIERLEEAGFLTTDPRYGALRLTGRAGEVLYRGERVEMALRRDSPTPGIPQAGPEPEEDGVLFQVLRAVRARLAQKEGVPVYVVFSNASLRDMACKAPVTEEAFLAVSGVGAVKAARYGEPFLAAIRDYLETREQD